MELAGLILAIVALGSWAGSEWLKRPRLEVLPATWARGQETWLFAVVCVRNRPLARPFRWLLIRQSAEGCKAEIEFRRPGEHELSLPEVQGRWSGTPQPIKLIGIDTLGQPVHTFDPQVVPLTTQITLPPTEQGHELGVAFIRDDGCAYAWGANSYAYGPEWRNPEWALDRAVYEVTVCVRASGIAKHVRFRLDNLSADMARFKITRA